MKEKIDAWLQVAGLELTGLIIGGLGAAVSLALATRAEAQSDKKLTGVGKLVTFFSGTMTAAYCGPLLVIGTGLPDRATSGVIFVTGVGGMVIVEAFLKQSPETIRALRRKFLGE